MYKLSVYVCVCVCVCVCYVQNFWIMHVHF